MEIGIPLIVVAVALFIVGLLMRRQRPPVAPEAPAGAALGPVDLDVVHYRPPVAEMHVVGDEARVTFDVPLPDQVDEALADILVAEAVEYVREKRHTLPMSQVAVVTAFAGRGVPREVGRAKLDTPGVLPPEPRAPWLPNLSRIAVDPLAGRFEEAPPTVPETVAPTREERLAPVGSELRLPRAVETGLRAQGIDPATMTASEMVRGMLSLLGYQVSAGIAPGTWTAEKAGRRTLLREDPGEGTPDPETDEQAVRSFLVEFVSSGADQGLFVSGKYAPFSIYDVERREPRIRFLGRERLQRFVDTLALS